MWLMSTNGRDSSTAAGGPDDAVTSGSSAGMVGHAEPSKDAKEGGGGSPNLNE